MSEYVLVTGSSKDQFAAVINQKLQEGYSLVGGISITQNVQIPVAYQYAQAMLTPVKVSDREK